MIGAVNNSNNEPKITRANIGILNPPDHLYKPKLYDTEEPKKTRKHNSNTNNKSHVIDRQTDFKHKHKTPTGIFLLLGIGVVTALFMTAKKFIAKVNGRIKP